MITTASGINTPPKKKVEKTALFAPIIPKISTSDIYSLQDYFYKMRLTDNMPMRPALQSKVRHSYSQRKTRGAKNRLLDRIFKTSTGVNHDNAHSLKTSDHLLHMQRERGFMPNAFGDFEYPLAPSSRKYRAAVKRLAALKSQH